MEITKTTADDKLVIAPEGFIDTANAPAFEAAVDDGLAENKHLILDFTKVEYISSSGLRVLLKGQKKVTASGGSLVIKNVSSAVKDVFEMTGFLDILTIQ